MADAGQQLPNGTAENGSGEVKKSKKPADTAFKQQRLPAWQPVMTAKTVIPAFFVIGIIFVPVGAVLFTTSQGIKEHIIDYTDASDCKDCYDSADWNTTCTCSISFELESDFEAPVYMYYGLDNFYQNHRRYVKSRDDNQLLGKVMSLDGKSSLTDDCNPYRNDSAGNIIAPCGAIANSMFNDSLSLTYKTNVQVPLNRRGIAWPTDKKSKFQNPEGDGPLCDREALKDTAKPPNWSKRLCELDLEFPDNNGYQNEDLIVWMRTAALPNFRKLYRKINETGDFEKGLPAGNYTLDIEYNYHVKAFDGRKKVILSTVSWLGGKNPFLGIAYMVVGVICILLALTFVVIHCKMGKSAEEMTDVTNRTPYNSHHH